MSLTSKDLDFLKTENAEWVVRRIWQEIPKDKNEKPTGFPEHLCKIWSMLKPLLIAAKVFTNDAADKIIDGIISAGDSYCTK